MINLAPSLPPADVAATYKVLELIGDPAACKKRLDQITKAQAEAEKAATEAQAIADKTEQTARRAEAAVKRAEELARKNDKEREQLDQRGAGLNAREEQLKQRETAWNDEAKKQKAEQEAAAAILEGERSNHAERERQLSKDRAKFDADRAALDRKLGKMKAALEA